jgi:glycosyltransferase involved in cell wall biosynthesis
MRVMQMTQRFPPAIGGVEEHVYHLSLGLSRSGHQVEVLTTDLLRSTPFARMGSNSKYYPFPVTRSRVWKLFEAPHGLGIVAPSMVRQAVKRRAEIVHAHAYGYFPTFAATLGSALDGCALVITPHSDAGRPSWSKSLFDRVVPGLTLKKASRVIAVTQHEAVHLTALGVDSEKVEVIPNGVDIGEFARPPKMRDGDEPIIGLFVGRIDSDQKGLHTLVRAVALLSTSLGLQIRLVGEDWGGTEPLRSLAQRLGVSDRLTFVGKLSRAELVEEYAQAQFFVLPSIFEPFGIVLLEAMAAGLPVIASRVGGIPEIVEDGRTGLLVEPGNPGSLAEALRHLCRDEVLRKSMGRRAREHVMPYDWELIVPRILSVYAEALEGRGG